LNQKPLLVEGLFFGKVAHQHNVRTKIKTDKADNIVMSTAASQLSNTVLSGLARKIVDLGMLDEDAVVKICKSADDQ